MSDERLLELIKKQDKYYILGFIQGLKANYEILTEENKELKEKLKATDKGLKKVILKRKKWKNHYELAKHEIKELKKQLEATEEIVETHMKKWKAMENQQKDFIEYMEDKINKFKELEKFAREVFGNNKIINIELAQKTIEENNLLISNFNIILAKYKEINHIADVEQNGRR